jgi:ketosteroid isomerase-like protein
LTPEARVRAILALAGDMNIERLAAYLRDDVVMELPFAPQPLRRRHEGKPAVVDFQQRAAASFSSFAMTVHALHVTDRGRVVVAEHSSMGVSATTGREYRNRYVTVFELDDDRLVRRWCEYYDPDAVRAAFM